jgi:hypothetical protein
MQCALVVSFAMCPPGACLTHSRLLPCACQPSFLKMLYGARPADAVLSSRKHNDLLVFEHQARKPNARATRPLSPPPALLSLLRPPVSLYLLRAARCPLPFCVCVCVLGGGADFDADGVLGVNSRPGVRVCR